MAPRFVLVHSPSVGPATWLPVARHLSEPLNAHGWLLGPVTTPE